MKTNVSLEQILKANGLKVTKHRTAVYNIIRESSQPISAEDVYFNLKEKKISINPSSIYKILDTLCNCSVINKSLIGDNNKTLYEVNNLGHRHHLICKSCNQVFPLTKCPLDGYNKEIEELMEFQITNHKLELYGYCKNCK